MRKSREKHCLYSDDCFKCPLKDCRINTCAALGVNCLPTDRIRGWALGEKHKAEDAV